MFSLFLVNRSPNHRTNMPPQTRHGVTPLAAVSASDLDRHRRGRLPRPEHAVGQRHRLCAGQRNHCQSIGASRRIEPYRQIKRERRRCAPFLLKSEDSAQCRTSAIIAPNPTNTPPVSRLKALATLRLLSAAPMRKPKSAYTRYQLTSITAKVATRNGEMAGAAIMPSPVVLFPPPRALCPVSAPPGAPPPAPAPRNPSRRRRAQARRAGCRARRSRSAGASKSRRPQRARAGRPSGRAAP
jgi:hypothetical protein